MADTTFISGTVIASTWLQEVNDQLYLKTTAPTTATSTGTTGQIASDGSFLYICTATNTWKRVAIASW